MNNFTSIAKEATSLPTSPIIEGREKVKVDALMAQYPAGITINGFDLLTLANKVTGEPEVVPVFTYAEDAGSYFFGGKALLDIANKWATLGDDIAAISADLATAGGVKVKFRKTTTKKGLSFTAVDVVE